MGFLNFAQCVWNVYSRPQKFRCFWANWTHKRDGHHQVVQKAHPCPKTQLHGDFGGDMSTGTVVRPGRENGEMKESKRHERNLQWQIGCSPRPPTLTQHIMVLHAGWSSRDSYKFQVSSKLVERVFEIRMVEIRYFLFPAAYITACITVQAVMTDAGATFLHVFLLELLTFAFVNIYAVTLAPYKMILLTYLLKFYNCNFAFHVTDRYSIRRR